MHPFRHLSVFSAVLTLVQLPLSVTLVKKGWSSICDLSLLKRMTLWKVHRFQLACATVCAGSVVKWCLKHTGNILLC